MYYVERSVGSAKPDLDLLCLTPLFFWFRGADPSRRGLRGSVRLINGGMMAFTVTIDEETYGFTVELAQERPGMLHVSPYFVVPASNWCISPFQVWQQGPSGTTGNIPPGHK